MKKLFTIALLCAAFLVPMQPQPVSASSPVTTFAVCGDGLNNFFGFEPWYACLHKKYNGVIRITSLNDLFLIIFPVLEMLIKLAGYIAAGMIFYMLFIIVSARGNSERLATGTRGISDAVLGFIICLVSIAMVNFIAGAFIAS